MLMEAIRCFAAAGVGVLLGRLLRPDVRSAAMGMRSPGHLEEATIACNPLQVIGGSRRGPGDGGSA
jgi:hypothetical protein